MTDTKNTKSVQVIPAGNEFAMYDQIEGWTAGSNKEGPWKAGTASSTKVHKVVFWTVGETLEGEVPAICGFVFFEGKLVPAESVPEVLAEVIARNIETLASGTPNSESLIIGLQFMGYKSVPTAHKG